MFSLTLRPHRSAVIGRLTHTPIETDSTVVQRAVWIIDVSGSMNGSMAALNHACRLAYEAMEIKPLILIFDNNCSEHVVRGTWINLPNYNQGTDIIRAFHTGFEFITRLGLLGCDLLFLTDGEHTGNTPLDYYIDNHLLAALTNLGITLHLIGYGSAHDITVMTRLRNCKHDNSFVYAANQSELTATFNRMITLGEPTITYRINDQTFTVSAGRPSITTLLLDSTTINFECDDKIVTIAIDDSPLTADEQLDFLDLRLRNIASRPTEAELAIFDHELDQFKLWFSDQPQRKLLYGRFLQYKSQVGLLYQVLRGTASTATRAQVLALTTVLRTGKAGADKAIDQRILANGDLRAEIEAKVLALPPVTGEPSVNRDDFICALSLDDWWDAMQNGTCMCVTIQVVRPVSAIANASMLRVTKVNLDCLTLDSFTDAVRGLGPTATLGGFVGKSVSSSAAAASLVDSSSPSTNKYHNSTPVVNPHSRSVINDRVIAPCNAVLPLFISDDHWQVAKLLLPLSLGFTCTFDERGYKSDQWYTVPYLVLAAAHLDPAFVTERGQLIYQAILRTCQMIMKPENLSKEVDNHCQALRQLSLSRVLCGNLRLFQGRVLANQRSLSVFERTCLVLEGIRRAVRLDGAAPSNLDRLAERFQISHRISITGFLPHGDFYADPHYGNCLDWVTLGSGLDLSPSQILLFEAWALYTCDREIKEDETYSQVFDLPHPLLNPTGCWTTIVERTHRYCVANHEAEIKAEVARGDVTRFFYGDAVEFTLGIHLYEGKYLSLFLDMVRHEPAGTLVEAQAKMDWLMGLHRTKSISAEAIAAGTNPDRIFAMSGKHERAFQRHIAAQTAEASRAARFAAAVADEVAAAGGEIVVPTVPLFDYVPLPEPMTDPSTITMASAATAASLAPGTVLPKPE